MGCDQEPGPEGGWLFPGLVRPWLGPRHGVGSCGLSREPFLSLPGPPEAGKPSGDLAESPQWAVAALTVLKEGVKWRW